MSGPIVAAVAIARVEPLTTARALRGPFDYALPESMAAVEVGSLLLVPFGRQRVIGVVVELARTSEVPPERLVEPIEALAAGVPAELVRLGLWVAREYCSTPARGLQLVLPPGLKTLSARRLTGELAKPRHAPAELAGRRGVVEMNAEQRAALERIVAALDGEEGSERQLLVHGVTGSGKTEVYLESVAAALERGRGAIVLVPEIGLTPQAMARFAARFGDLVALMHSRMSTGARYDEWLRLRRGEARVCVGPRSAVFAPVADLGLIMIDEEHDPSYKQEGDPRYDARAVARRRAADAGAALVAGTATPRPESWLELPRATLAQRADGAGMPEVDVVDMRGLDGSAGPLHPATVEALEQARRTGGKAIVLINRRGWSAYLTCRSCGRLWQCPNCDVSLVLHRATSVVSCHHCGHSERGPDACPDCGSVTLARHGAGSERIESLLAELLAPAPVMRLDSDAAGASDAHARILTRFDESPGAVLVGTQMVAKGHDFPEVVLSVVLDADATLRFPDFRAEERTFALVTQVAGRSGRGPRGGRVMVQTLSPQAPSIVSAARHDAEGFLAGELDRRRILRYPPFSHLIRVQCTSPDQAAVDRAARGLADRLGGAMPAGTDLLGPAPLFRMKDRHRRQIVIKAADRSAAVAAAGEQVALAASEKALRGVSLSVDVDPQ